MTKLEKAAFAVGCFWNVEETFRKVKGVVSTAVGYSGGKTKDPSYTLVCAGGTGHAETVQVIFDPKVISYGKLLDVFWRSHNPTQKNRQGSDVGVQYRSVIFYHSPQQKKLAEIAKNRIQDKYTSEIVTKITKVERFFKAEEYHQKYIKKRSSIKERFKGIFKIK